MSTHAAQAAVLVGFVDSGTRFAVQRAVDGAVRRLANPACQMVLADFSDPSGQSLAATFAAAGKDPASFFAPVRFVDDRDAAQCRQGSTLAFTAPGARVIHICGRRFRERSVRDPTMVEIIVIHEFLHGLGLSENPPTSEAITAQVAARCAA